MHGLVDNVQHTVTSEHDFSRAHALAIEDVHFAIEDTAILVTQPASEVGTKKCFSGDALILDANQELEMSTREHPQNQERPEIFDF